MTGHARAPLPPTQEIAIAAALAKCAAAVDVGGHGQWTFTLSNGSDLAARAHLDDGWLLLDAPLGVSAMAPASRLWELLQWNATLDGGARFALPADRSGLRVRAELPLDEEVDLFGRVLQACAGFKAAKNRIAHSPGEGADDPVIEGRGGAAIANLPDLCRETAWSFVEREPGRLAVDLDVPGAFQQATVETRSDLSVALRVRVLDAATANVEPPAPVCREALGLLLLRACGIVRMARAAAGVDGVCHARFEVVFQPQPCAAELSHALSALSVACRLASREAAVLWSDEIVARAYAEQWNARKEDYHGTDSSDDTAGE